MNNFNATKSLIVSGVEPETSGSTCQCSINTHCCITRAPWTGVCLVRQVNSKMAGNLSLFISLEGDSDDGCEAHHWPLVDGLLSREERARILGFTRGTEEVVPAMRGSECRSHVRPACASGPLNANSTDRRRTSHHFPTLPNSCSGFTSLDFPTRGIEKESRFPNELKGAFVPWDMGGSTYPHAE